MAGNNLLRERLGSIFLGCGCISILFVGVFVFGTYVLLHHEETKAKISNTQKQLSETGQKLSDEKKVFGKAASETFGKSTGYVSDGFKEAGKRAIEETHPHELNGPVGAIHLGTEVGNNAQRAVQDGAGKASAKGWEWLKKWSGADDTKYEKKKAEERKEQGRPEDKDSPHL